MERIYLEPFENERKYQELSRLGRELRIPITECFLELQVTMPDGEVTHHHKQRSHSWVRNGYNVLTCIMMAINYNDATYGAGFLNLKATNGTVQKRAGAIIYGYNDPDWENTGCGYMAAAGSLINGIVVALELQPSPLRITPCKRRLPMAPVLGSFPMLNVKLLPNHTMRVQKPIPAFGPDILTTTPEVTLPSMKSV